jgi:legumain
MAGSNTYSNYRHQADACHAYQIAKKNGIPESNIILLAYDDIADNSENPFPGKIFNKPDGPDVYEGCKISYRGRDVNRENFIKVLTGDASAPGPVLKSSASDRVFVYFADHGGVGILGVPNGASGGYIHASDVNKALETMHSKSMYKELLFYVEACESGSIFKDLLKAPNVVAVTAANAAESSWGYYCYPHDKVNGKHIGSCLGDEFSIRWMEDSDKGFMATETVAQQISKVRREVSNYSHVQQFGDGSVIGAEVIGDFEGSNAGNASKLSGAMNSLAILEDGFAHSAVNSRDIDVHLAYSKMQQAVTLQQRREAQTALASVVGERMALDEKFMRIAMLAVNGDRVKAQAMIDGDLEALGNVACHVEALEVVVESCGALDDYTMRYSRLFANLCSVANLPNEKIEQAVKAVCSPKKPEVVV